MRLFTFFIFLVSALIDNAYGFVGSVSPADSDTISPVRQINSSSLIYSGPEYVKTYTAANGTPFFSDNVVYGWVDYFQNRYLDIPIQYDIESDLVIFHEPINQIRISLVNEKVGGFMINDHHFISIKDASGFRGYYEELYTGTRQVLVKWFKIFTRTGTEEGRYVSYSNVYIKEGNAIRQVSSKKDLFGAFGKHKKQVQQYYKSQHLSYKNDPAHTVELLVAYAEKNGF